MLNRFFPSYDTYKITSRFGMRTLNGVTKMHKGIDLVAKTKNGGSATDYVVAHTSGTVIGSGYDSSAGNYVKIQTAPNVIMVYYHLANRAVDKGKTVKQGDILGYMGATGKVTGAHLHFGIQDNGEWVDPEPYLDCNYPVKDAGQPDASNTKVVAVQLPVLSRGDKGEDVRAMQALLALRGFPCGEQGTDGSFGPATEDALKAFQKDNVDASGNQLKDDGLCGPATWGSLVRLLP